MAKITLAKPTSGYNLAAINNNFTLIEQEFQNKILYRDNPVGEANSLETDIDANSKRLYNLPEPTLPSEAARLQDVQNAISGISTANLVASTPSGNLVATNVQAALNELDTEKVSLAALAATSGSSLVGFHSSTGRTVEQQLDMLYYGIANVLDPQYAGGADPTGAAFSTAALQAAHASGKNVFYPDGAYKVNDTVPISIYREMVGASSAGVVITNTNNAVYAFEYLSPLTGPNDIDGGLQIDGFTINSKYGIRLNQSGNYATIFNLQGHIKKIKISNVNITGTYVNGVDANQDSAVAPTAVEMQGYGCGISVAKLFDSEITLCKIEYTGIAINADGCDINNFHLNRLNKNGWHFYHLGHDTYGGQTKFKDNDCLYNRRIGGVYLFNTIYASIKDNYFENYSNSATFIKTESDSGTLISENRFDDPGLAINFMSLAPYYGMVVTANRYTGPAVATIQVLPTYYDITKQNFVKSFGNQAGFPSIDYPLCLKTPDIDGSSFRYDNSLPMGGSAATAMPFIVSPTSLRYVLGTSAANADVSLSLVPGKKYYNIKYTGQYIAGGGYHIVSHVSAAGVVTAINAGGYIGFVSGGGVMSLTESIAIPDALGLSGTIRITIVNTEVEIERIDMVPTDTLYLDAIPTGSSVTYKIGMRIRKLTPQVGQPKGWSRITSGTANVLNTDWVSEGNL